MEFVLILCIICAKEIKFIIIVKVDHSFSNKDKRAGVIFSASKSCWWRVSHRVHKEFNNIVKPLKKSNMVIGVRFEKNAVMVLFNDCVRQKVWKVLFMDVQVYYFCLDLST